MPYSILLSINAVFCCVVSVHERRDDLKMQLVVVPKEMVKQLTGKTLVAKVEEPNFVTANIYTLYNSKFELGHLAATHW